MNYGNITSAELFGMIDEALHATDQATRSRLLHETLQLTVEAGLRGTTHSFGNLASRVDRLCRKLRLNKQMQRHVHRLRVHSHAAEASSDSDFHSDLRTLAMLIAAVFSTPIPAHLHATLPPLTTEVSEEKPATVPHLRCIVNSWTDITIHAQAIGETLSGDITILIVHEKLFTDYAYLPTLLREGMQIALLDAQVVEDKLVPRLIVVEPDYLLDTSALAACFEDYGHHPLSYTVRRMAGPVLSTPILIGNLAGEVLNETI
ncbi:MAG: DNA helicase, partial [Prevotella sp.]|nr:DNA helicase [Prevotella sp.]